MPLRGKRHSARVDATTLVAFTLARYNFTPSEVRVSFYPYYSATSTPHAFRQRSPGNSRDAERHWSRLHHRRQIYVRKPKKVSMDGNARAEPCTRKLAWFRSATCMVGLRNLHGSALRFPWFSFRHCMDRLENRNLQAQNDTSTCPPCALVAPKLCEGASSRRLSAHALNHLCPP